MKFVLHYGNFVGQSIAGRERLLGPAINVVHRLLKNSVTGQTGKRAYLFVTDAAAVHLELPPASGQAHEERFGDVVVATGVVVDIAVGTSGPGVAVAPSLLP